MSSKSNKKKKKNAKKNITLTPTSTSVSSVTDGQNDTKNLTLIIGETPSLVTASELADNEGGVQASTKDNSLEQSSDFHQSPTESGDTITTTASRKAVGIGSSSHVEHMSSTKKKSRKRKAKKTSDMNTGSSQVNNLSELNEKSFTFLEQLEWCIGQLELGLLCHDASKAQKDSNEKNIKTLRSLKVPVPRKRQLMRSLFGDYRSKMIVSPLSEVRGHSAAKHPHVSVVDNAFAERCGKFFKYKHSYSKSLVETGETGNSAEGQQLFHFDFVIDS